MTGRLDAECVASEVYRVEIHGQNFFFAVQHFNLDRCNPFLGLHNQ